MGDYFMQPVREADIHFIVVEITAFKDCNERRSMLFGALQLPPSIEVDLEKKNPFDSYKYFREVISKWINLKGNEANTVELDKALRSIEWNAAADSVKDKWFAASRSKAAGGANIQNASKSGQLNETIWFNMRDPISSFNGREDTLEQVHNIFFPVNVGEQDESYGKIKSTQVAVVGLGGIGKSEFARKFAQIYYTEFDKNVAWMNAESAKLLEESFQELATKIGIETINMSGKKDILKMIQSVYERISASNSLFIFDNVESWVDGENGIRDYLPTIISPDAKKPFVLMTSRIQPSGIKVIELSVLAIDEAVELIKTRLEVQEVDCVELLLQLAKLLGCLPLALQQASSYIKQEMKSGISGKQQNELLVCCIGSYIEKFKVNRKKLLDHTPSEMDVDFRELKTTLLTWRITLERIQKLGVRNNWLTKGIRNRFPKLFPRKLSKALKLLGMMSYISPDSIHLELFEKGFMGDDLRDAANTLIQFSMISKHSANSNIVSVHRLVQSVVRLENEEQESTLERMLKLLHLMGGVDKSLESVLNLLDVILEQLPDSIIPYTTSCILHAQVAWEFALAHPKLLNKFEGYPVNLYKKAKLHGIRTKNLSLLRRTLSKYKFYGIFEESNEQYVRIQHLIACAPNEPIWFNMRDPISSFKGRGDTLEQVHNIFFPVNVGQHYKSHGKIKSTQVAVVGLGGIGKSEFARKFAQMYYTEFDKNVAWMNAESAQLLQKSFKKLAAVIGIDTTNLSGKNYFLEVIQSVYEHCSQSNSLFIFDNVGSWFDGEDALRDYYLPKGLEPDSKTPYILITSRVRPKESENVAVVDLSVLTEAEAVQLIQHRLGTEISEFPLKLATLLGNLPLALQQAISYIQQEIEEDISGMARQEVVARCIQSYIEMFDTEPKKLLGYKDSDFDSDFEELQTTLVTWRITLDKIQELSPSAIQLLEMMSYISPDDIHLEMFEDQFTIEDMKTAVNTLVSFSMITKISNIVSVHRLVQRVVRMDHKEKQEGSLGDEGDEGNSLENIILVLNLLNIILNELPDKITPYSTSCVIHAQVAWEHALAYPRLLKQFVDYPSNLDKKAELHGMHTANLLLLQRTLSKYKLYSIYEESDEQYIRIQDLIASVLLDLHKYEDAKSLCKVIHKTAAEELGDSHWLTLAILNGLALAESGLGNHSEQIIILDNVIAIKTATPNIGPYHKTTLTSLHNKAACLANMGKYDEALELLKSTLELEETHHPEDRKSINDTRYWIAITTRRQGNSAEALLMFRNVHAEWVRRIANFKFAHGTCFVNLIPI